VPGFKKPTTTPTPDEIFDVWLSEITGAELKVLLYIVRRTFGFGKDADTISLSQITTGITKKDGKVLDRGTGLSRKSAYKAIQSLEAKSLITVDRAIAEDGFNEINIYSLIFEEGVGEKFPYGRGKSILGVGEKFPPQETVVQETVVQETDNSNRPPTNKKYSEDITRIISDFSKQALHDEEHIASNIAQAHNLWKASELPEEEFVKVLYTAKVTTLKKSGSIKKAANEHPGLKNRAPYFFAVLKDLARGPEE
jgi:hypothetical protein